MLIRGLLVATLLFGLAACNQGSLTPGNQLSQQPTLAASNSGTPISDPFPAESEIPTPVPDRLLTICLVNEPRSLFLYDALSTSEQSVLSAIYDGPIDIKNFMPQPVILQKMPSQADGDALFQAVQAMPGDLIMDSHGSLTNLAEGVSYKPKGCTEISCAQTYSGTDPVEMDQLILRYKLLPGLTWSDGSALTAADSVYSYEVARRLYPAAAPQQLNHVASYTALDDLTVEWKGIPGYIDSHYETKFFSPLPQHAWANIPVTDLPNSDISSRTPLGWGAYVIEDWVSGDHITLHRNPSYFRANEGLPYFDHLVYRFVADGAEALSAVLAGECDIADQSAGLDTQANNLIQLQNQKRLSLTFQSGYAWELLDFNIKPLDPAQPAYFASKEVRQAVALCIDRQALVEQLSDEHLTLADMYIPPEHPLYNLQIKTYSLNQSAADQLLTSAGWLDNDNAPTTPRIAQGVDGIADGTVFSVQYLTADDAGHQAVAQAIKAGLTQCGIQVNVITQPAQEYLAAGPDGPVFGRKFDLAQYAWMSAVEPPCYLYLSNEIPGPYPDYAIGWGGVNAGG